MFGNTPSDPLSQLPVTNPNGQHRPGLRNAMSVNAGTYHHQQQQRQQQQQMHSRYRQQQQQQQSMNAYHQSQQQYHPQQPHTSMQQQQQGQQYAEHNQGMQSLQSLQQQRSDGYVQPPSHQQHAQQQTQYHSPQRTRPLRRMSLKDVKSEPIPVHNQPQPYMNQFNGMYPQQQRQMQMQQQQGMYGGGNDNQNMPMSPQEYTQWYNEHMQQRQQPQQQSQGYHSQTNGFAANTQSQGYGNMGNMGNMGNQNYQQQQHQQYSANNGQNGQNNGLYANSQQQQQASISLSPLLQTPRSTQSQQSMPHSRPGTAGSADIHGQIGQVVTSPQSKFAQQSHFQMPQGSRPQRPAMKSAYSEQLHNRHSQQQPQRPLDDLCVTPRFYGQTQNGYSPPSLDKMSSLSSMLGLKDTIDQMITQHQAKHTQQQNWMNNSQTQTQAQQQPASRFTFQNNGQAQIQPSALQAAVSDSAAVGPPDLHFGLSGDPLSPSNVLNKPLMAARSCQ